LVQGAAGHLACVYAYANLLGCDNSRLVFDGGGFIATPEEIVSEGPVLSTAPWTLATGVVDLDDVARIRGENTTWRQQAAVPGAQDGVAVVHVPGAFAPVPVADYAQALPGSFFMPEARERSGNESDDYLDELCDALVLGLRDYFEKVGAFE